MFASVASELASCDDLYLDHSGDRELWTIWADSDLFHDRIPRKVQWTDSGLCNGGVGIYTVKTKVWISYLKYPPCNMRGIKHILLMLQGAHSRYEMYTIVFAV